MVGHKVIERLKKAFPNSFINGNLEFIAHKEANEYFWLENCECELDVKCKVLEWLSRAAYKTCPFQRASKNKKFHEFMLKGINTFLETDFTEEDMNLIYTYLGGAIKHTKTEEFVLSAYDMSFFKQFQEDKK